MGREVRRVPPNWEHPKDEKGNFIPLYGRSYAEAAAEWDEECAKWDRGEFAPYVSEEHRLLSYAEWDGERPREEDYMPDWPESERTHLMMYENTSEGTPISPAFETPEKLARWLADTGASAFGGMTASYEAWLATIQNGRAVSAVADARGFRSGVEFMGEREKRADSVQTPGAGEKTP